MLFRNPVNLLIAACVTMTLLLGYIQFRLVDNTYQLTRDQYKEEILNRASAELREQGDSINTQALDTLEHMAREYVSQQISRKQFLQQLSRIKPKPGRLIMQYEEIVMVVKGEADTLIKRSGSPLLLAGAVTAHSKKLVLFQGTQTSGYRAQELNHRRLPVYSLFIFYGKYVDIAGWQRDVLWRMGWTFFWSVSIVIAVVALFFAVFRALLRQKKIALVKTDFANNITHELQTPLSSARIITETLQMQEVQTNREMFNELLGSLDRQLKKLQYISDSVLESAFSTGGVINFVPLDTRLFLATLVNDFKTTNHQVRLTLGDQPQVIQTEPGRLQSILDNLLENAVKYSPCGSVVAINAYANENKFFIEVADEGCGIPVSEQEKIFDKFYRIPEKDIHTVKGLGLGLYQCRRKAIELGGQITVSARSGGGTIFTLKLPLI